MSRSQSELSLTQREILQLVIYRTKNPKSPTFFGNNEYIGKCVNVKPDTVRKALKELKDFGYIMEAKDDKGRRHLAYTGKEFPPIIEDMRNMDKRMLKQEKDSSLLDMRKDDKILGVQRIPYVGEGKNSRYYVPLLQAYKNKDMKKVAELEKEMHQKENEI